MIEKINNFIDCNKENLIKDVIEFVNINSIKSEAKKDMPNGEGTFLALTKAIKLCEKYNLKTKNIDGVMAYGQDGFGEDYIGVFCHLDVVGVEGVWDSPPFEATIRDNRIYGRGALDNKGPSLAAFYGFLAFKSLNIPLKRPIRFVFGTDEESGMADIKHYLTKEKKPLMGFVPDNKFPAIYGERGRLELKISGEEVQKFYAEYFLNSQETLNKLDLDFVDEDFGKLIIRNIRYDKKDLIFTICSNSFSNELIIDKIKAKIGNLTLTVIKNTPTVLKDKNSILVKTLNDVYNKVQNENLKPTTTTGNTYAHYCDTIIPFGPSFPGQNGIAHLPNEWIDIDDLIKCSKIYGYAFYKLNEID